MTSLRVGILGTGNIAAQFADGVRYSARCTLAAVASRSREKADAFADRFAIAQRHLSYDALLRDDAVDAIYLSLPNALHHEWSIKALRANKHVLCEKPIATTAAEASEMFDVARSMGRVLIEAFMYRAHPQTRAVVELVQSGVIGHLKLIKTSFCFRVRQTAGNIRFDKSLAGGALMDVGCYCVSFARLLAGEDPDRVRAVGRFHESGVDEQCSAVLHYPGGVTADFTVSLNTQADNTAHVCGDEGYLAIPWPWKPSPPATSIRVRHAIPPKQDTTRTTASADREIVIENDVPLYAIEADAFASTVLDGATPFVSEAETLGNMKTIEAIAAAMRQNIGPN